MRYHQFTNLTVMFFPINLLNWRYTVQSTVLQRPEIPRWVKSTSTTECRVTTTGFHSDNAQSSQSSLMLWSLRGAEPTVIYRLCSLFVVCCLVFLLFLALGLFPLPLPFFWCGCCRSPHFPISYMNNLVLFVRLLYFHFHSYLYFFPFVAFWAGCTKPATSGSALFPTRVE